MDSFLVQRNHCLNRVVTDEDVRRNQFSETVPSFKIRGDLWLEHGCLTIAALKNKLIENPQIKEQISQVCKREPVILIGFKPNSNLFRWLVDTFTDAQSSILVCFVSSNRLGESGAKSRLLNGMCANSNRVNTEVIRFL